MKKNVLLSISILSLMIILSSCAKVPQAEIDNAKAAIDQAKEAGADVYVADQFMALNDSLSAAMENVEKKKGKMFANYDDVKKQLEAIVTLANTVKENAGTRKAEVMEEVKSGIAELNMVIAEDKTLLTQAPKGKEGKEALEAIGNDINMLDSTMVEINNMFTNEDYMGALDKVKVTKDKATSLNTELKDAIAKTTKK